MQNVATLLNIRRAVDGHPVITRPITVAGEVVRPGVYEAPVGTSVAEVIAAAGGALRPDVAVIEGGPMMGWLLPSLDHPVTKTTSGYLVLPSDNPAVLSRKVSMATQMRRATAVCCQCRTCTDLCPRALLGHRIRPHLAMRAALAGWAVPPDVLAMGYLCSQCGVCEVYACTMGLSPRAILGEYRGRVGAAKTPNPYRNRPEAAEEAQAWARAPKPRVTMRLNLAEYVLPHDGAIVPVPDPWEVCLLLKQHVGAPAVARVRKGDAVVRGQMVADIPEGALGARLHASIDGVVSFVDDRSIRIARAP